MEKSELEFTKWKLQTLSKVDLSRKGSIDDPIRDLVTFINEQEQYCTTSSCSGRICVLSDNPFKTKTDNSVDFASTKSKNCIWYLVSHNKVTPSEVLEALQNVTAFSKLKFEAFVMHVKCRKIEDARLLHKVAVSSGYRNSGITLGKQGRNIMMAVRGTQCLEVPLTGANGERLTSSEYIDHIVQIANHKFEENCEKIENFETSLRNVLLSQTIKVEKESLHVKQNHILNMIKAKPSYIQEGDKHCADDTIINDIQNLFGSADS